MHAYDLCYFKSKLLQSVSVLNSEVNQCIFILYWRPSALNIEVLALQGVHVKRFHGINTPTLELAYFLGQLIMLINDEPLPNNNLPMIILWSYYCVSIQSSLVPDCLPPLVGVAVLKC